MHDSNELATIVSTRRSVLRLTLRDVAAATGINLGNLSRIESGKKIPEPETLSQLSQALGLPLADLYTAAGYPLPETPPSLRVYLRRAYNVPEGAVDEIERYLRRLSLDTSGPAPGEDEKEDEL